MLVLSVSVQKSQKEKGKTQALEKRRNTNLVAQKKCMKHIAKRTTKIYTMYKEQSIYVKELVKEAKKDTV